MLFTCASPGGVRRDGIDSSCTNGDLLCFALHMIMIDSGYQPNVSCTHSLPHSSTHSFSPPLPSRPQSPSLTHTLTHLYLHLHTTRLPSISTYRNDLLNLKPDLLKYDIKAVICNSSGKRLQSWDSNYSTILNLTGDNFQPMKIIWKLFLMSMVSGLSNNLLSKVSECVCVSE